MTDLLMSRMELKNAGQLEKCWYDRDIADSCLAEDEQRNFGKFLLSDVFSPYLQRGVPENVFICSRR